MSIVEAFLELLRGLTGTFCHLDPERTMSAGELSCPMCLRCSGFHSAFLFGVLAHWASRRGPAMSRPLIIAAAVALLVLALDAKEIIWSTGNVQRFFTGMAGGLGLAAIAMPLVYRTRVIPAEELAKYRQIDPRHLGAMLGGAVVPTLLFLLDGKGGVVVLSLTTFAGLAGLFAVGGVMIVQLVIKGVRAARRPV